MSDYYARDQSLDKSETAGWLAQRVHAVVQNIRVEFCHLRWLPCTLEVLPRQEALILFGVIAGDYLGQAAAREVWFLVLLQAIRLICGFRCQQLSRATQRAVCHEKGSGFHLSHG